MKLPELLAPVGSMEHLKLAVFSGASSIYLSGKKFGARKYAENFKLSEIKKAIEFAHMYNVKAYVTVNILINDSELAEAMDYIFELYKIGVDAILVQDIGLLSLLQDIIPEFPVHASTQMNIQNIEGIKWAKDNGISRVVLPRELNYYELKEMIDFAHSLDIETEIFAHGALCFSYSGRCLFSSLIGGRSGNRGTCAQPCRQKYQILFENKEGKRSLISNYKNEDYLISPKDLSLYDNISKLIELNVDSLKIEGRMRNTDYVATVINQYRKKLNQFKGFNSNIINSKQNYKNNNKNLKNKDKKDKKLAKNIIGDNENLQLVFNRGFTSGHLFSNQSHSNYNNDHQHNKHNKHNKYNKFNKDNNYNKHANYYSKSKEFIMSRKKPGHIGLFIGKIVDFNKSNNNQLLISLNSNIKNIPEKGDGLLIESKNDSYGFEVSNDPKSINKFDDFNNSNNYNNSNTFNNSKNINDNIIISINLVKENKHVNMDIKKGNNVYLTKRKRISDFTKSILHDEDIQSFKKIPISINFSIDSSSKLDNINDNIANNNSNDHSNDNNDKELIPVLEGFVKLDNGKTINIVEKGKHSWEKAKNKPISVKQLKKQLSKIGNLPFYFDDININYPGNLFAPISQINEFRRFFFNNLEKAIIDSYKPDLENIKSAKRKLSQFKMYNEFENNDNADNTNNADNADNTNNNKNNKDNNADNNKINKNSIGNDFQHNSQEYSLSLYINNLELLKEITNDKNVADKFTRIYLEVPVEDKFDSMEKPVNISYYLNFLKEAITLSENQNYNLIWKWPDLIHKDAKENLIKIIGILKKLEIKIDVMTSSLGFSDYLSDNYGVNIYGSYPLNVFNSKTALKLNDFNLLTLSPELSKENLDILMKNYNNIYNSYNSYNSHNKNQDNYLNNNDNKDTNIGNKKSSDFPNLEIIVKGRIESLISRNPILTKKHVKSINKLLNNLNINNSDTDDDYFNNYVNNYFNIYLNDFKNNNYPIKKVEGGNLLLNSVETNLIGDIPDFISLGITNFAIDARWISKGHVFNI